MKWVLLNKTHVNTNTVTAFRWDDGELLLWFIGEEKPAKYRDPYLSLYLQLCHALGVRPYEEESHDKE
jgi:hypothetical protein